jgi:O-antigen ligase
LLIYPHLLAAGVVGIPFQHAYRSGFAEVTGVHPPYAAYWFFAVALFQLHGLLTPLQGEGSWIRVVRMFALAVCLLAGLLIGSRMPVIAFAIAALVLVARALQWKHAVQWGIIIMGFTAMAAWLSPALRERTEELTGSGVEHLDTEQTSISIRTPIMHCSFSLLEEHWILGTGQAELQPALDRCYEQLDHNAMTGQGYGPHDQPLQWWLALGLAGLCAFVLLFGWSMREAWLHKHHLHLALLVFIILCCLTEDLLTRQWGVVFFAFFNTLFITQQREVGPANDH